MLHTVAGGDRSTLKEFCAQKAAAAAGAHANDEVETWTFLGVMFEEDARRQLLSKLGFSDVLGGTSVARTQSVGLNAAADHLAAATEQLRVSADGECQQGMAPSLVQHMRLGLIDQLVRCNWQAGAKLVPPSSILLAHD